MNFLQKILLKPFLYWIKIFDQRNYFLYGKIILKFSEVNALENKKEKKISSKKNSKKIYIIGPSIVRSLSLHKDFIPLNCFSAYDSCFFGDNRNDNVENYKKILRKIKPGKIVVLALATHDPDLTLRKKRDDYEKGYKKISTQVLNNLNISAENNLKIAKYSKEILKHKTVNFLSWPHINSNVSRAIRVYNKIIKEMCIKNYIEFIDISKNLTVGNEININKKWRVSKNEFHLKPIISKFLIQKLYKIKKSSKKFEIYKWKNIFNFKFKDTGNILLSPLPFKGNINALDPLVQYSHLENIIANILTGYCFVKNYSNIYLYNCGEGSLSFKLPINFFKKIIIFNNNQNIFELTNEIIEFTNRNEIDCEKTYNLKKLNVDLLFINLNKDLIKIKTIKKLLNEKFNEIILFGNKSLIKNISIKFKKKYIVIKNFDDEVLGNEYQNFELVSLV